ncbi:MAG: AraC family transcriptional regulator [Lachnospiraceae bacterium]|nr:AraC family transcriptional regulator [Lachnospiraceae bacterium]
MKTSDKIGKRIRILDAADERQYMIGENYEVYEKQGAPIGAMTFHYHNFYEIIYVLEGEYSSMLETRTYHMKKGDFLLINQNVMHKYHYVEKKHDSSKRIILWVTPKLLAELSGGDMDFCACFQSGSCAYHFPIYYEELLQGYLLRLAMTELVETKQPGAKQVLDRGYLTLFFTYLNILCTKKEYMFAREELVTHPLVELVVSYIDEHMEEKISLDCLAEHVHMSKYHFLRKFKELTGMTVHAFVVNKWLIRACEALREGASVAESWQRTGFSEYTSYLRNFREKFGVSPGKYRELYPEER